MARYNKLKFLMEECMKKKIRILFWYGLIGVAEV